MGCGASVSDEELDMRKVVMTAAKTNDLPLMQKAINDIKTKYNDPAKTRAACGMYDYEEGPERWMMALKWAAENGNVEMCKLLIECGATIDSAMYADRRHNGRFTSPGGVTALGRAAAAGKMDTVKYLVEAGADPKYRDILGHSAGDLAGMQGHMEVLKFLRAAEAGNLPTAGGFVMGDKVESEIDFDGKTGKVRKGDVGVVIGRCIQDNAKVCVDFPNMKSLGIDPSQIRMKALPCSQ